MAWRLWARGLLAAVIGSVSGAISMVMVDPLTYNLFNGGARKLGEVAGAFAVVAAAAYLKQHPVPDDGWADR